MSILVLRCHAQDAQAFLGAWAAHLLSPSSCAEFAAACVECARLFASSAAQWQCLTTQPVGRQAVRHGQRLKKSYAAFQDAGGPLQAGPCEAFLRLLEPLWRACPSRPAGGALPLCKARAPGALQSMIVLGQGAVQLSQEGETAPSTLLLQFIRRCGDLVGTLESFLGRVTVVRTLPASLVALRAPDGLLSRRQLKSILPLGPVCGKRSLPGPDHDGSKKGRGSLSLSDLSDACFAGVGDRLRHGSTDEGPGHSFDRGEGASSLGSSAGAVASRLDSHSRRDLSAGSCSDESDLGFSEESIDGVDCGDCEGSVDSDGGGGIDGEAWAYWPRIDCRLRSWPVYGGLAPARGGSKALVVHHKAMRWCSAVPLPCPQPRWAPAPRPGQTALVPSLHRVPLRLNGSLSDPPTPAPEVRPADVGPAPNKLVHLLAKAMATVCKGQHMLPFEEVVAVEGGWNVHFVMPSCE